MIIENQEIHTCIYCGQEAHYQFKNGKWCCSSNKSKCPANRKRISSKLSEWHKNPIPKIKKYKNEGDHICSYCGNYADYKLKNGNWCCQPSQNSCPAIKEKNSIGIKRSYQNIPRHGYGKGETKETNSSIAKRAQTLKEGYASGRIIPAMKGKPGTWIGRKHSEETKKKMSLTHKKQWQGKCIWSTQIEKRKSYAEQYFESIFLDAKRNYHVDRYFLDFAWPEKKIYIEVDGEQHYKDPKIIEHDKIRTEILESLNWKCIKRIRWSAFKKLSNDKKKQTIDSILEQISKILLGM